MERHVQVALVFGLVLIQVTFGCEFYVVGLEETVKDLGYFSFKGGSFVAAVDWHVWVLSPGLINSK